MQSLRTKGNINGKASEIRLFRYLLQGATGKRGYPGFPVCVHFLFYLE